MCYIADFSLLYSKFVYVIYYFFFFKQKTAYEMRISDWSFRRVLFRSRSAFHTEHHPAYAGDDDAGRGGSGAPGQSGDRYPRALSRADAGAGIKAPQTGKEGPR